MSLHCNKYNGFECRRQYFGSSEILAVFGVHSFGYTAGLPLLIAVMYILYRTGVNPIKSNL